jgi:acetyl/propionyl-CoA carboxylase alpha subunit
MREVTIGKRVYKSSLGTDLNEVSINDKSHNSDVKDLGNGHFHIILDGRSVNIEVIDADEQNPTIKVNRRVYQPIVKSETDLLLERLGMSAKAKKEVKDLKAPMPGLVLEFRVAPGDQVKMGDPLVVLEAMKMENVLKSPADVTVKSLNVNKGDAINKNTVLITFE